MKYLMIQEDGSLQVVRSISDEDRVSIEDGVLSIVKFENDHFHQLEVSVAESDGDVEDAVEVGDNYYEIGSDTWTEISE